MAPRIYWCRLPEARGGLAITSRPRGAPELEADVAHWRSAGLGGVVSLLEPDEAAMLRLEGQGAALERAGLRFYAFPVGDHGVPNSMDAFDEMAGLLASQIARGENLAFHCFASMGRSPMLAAGVLVRLGVGADDAIARLSTARGLSVPETSEQVDWIADYERLYLRRDW